MRKQPILTSEYYHIYNRGVDKRDIFNEKEDIKRFIESIKEFNQIEVIGSLRNLRKDKNEDIKNTKTVPKALSTLSTLSTV